MSSRKGSTWLTNNDYPLPEQRLIAAVLTKAIRDARSGASTIRNDALAYLNGRNFEADCACLNLDPTRVRTLLETHHA
jgi:hypothetical protein